MADYYNFKNIRILLTKGFTENDLLELCFDEPELRPVYENRAEAAGKSNLVRQIIDHAHTRLAIESVLNWAKDHNPARYEKHQPYYQPGPPKTQENSSQITLVLPDNDLGKGITLGGVYRTIPFRIVATKWAEYGESWVRSGWLFIPQWTENHAIAFFKIHAYDVGVGYIHLVDVSDPKHTIWLTTETGFKKEGEFHYIMHPSDTWEFVWREQEI